MEIIALQEYTDNKVSLYEGEIRNIENNLAQKLIAEGIVAEHSDSGSGSGGGNGIEVLSVSVSPDFSTNPPGSLYTPDKTFDQIKQAFDEGKQIVIYFSTGRFPTFMCLADNRYFAAIQRNVVAQGQTLKIIVDNIIFAPDNTFSITTTEYKTTLVS